jgi:hypothetical protein
MVEFIEVKRHLNKPDERYQCELIRKEPDAVVLRYISDRSFQSSELGISFPPGCITIAFYWQSRPYVFWGIYSPQKQLLGYLAHICKEMRIDENSVSYLDMLLDIWFFPDGRRVILDEDEVAECVEAGVLSQEDTAYIDVAKNAAVRDFSLNVNASAVIADSLDFLPPSQ